MALIENLRPVFYTERAKVYGYLIVGLDVHVAI